MTPNCYLSSQTHPTLNYVQYIKRCRRLGDRPDFEEQEWADGSSPVSRYKLVEEHVRKVDKKERTEFKTGDQ
jgi:hypothetical protein